MKKSILLIMGVLVLSASGFAQKYGNTPQDSINCIQNISLYSEFYKQKNYKDAYKPWLAVFETCPQASINTFIRGANILESIYQSEKNAAIKEKIFDTLMLMHDMRIKYFGNEGLVLGKKGVDICELKPERYKEANQLLAKSISLQGNASEASTCYYYFVTTIKIVQAEKLDKSLIVDAYDKASDIIDFNLQNSPKDSASYASAKNNVEYEFEPFATCADLITIYSPKFDANPSDIALLKRLTKILNKKGCVDHNLFYKATENLHKKEPTAESAFLMGKLCYSTKQYNKADDYLSEAAKAFTTDNEKAKVYSLLADVYGNLGQFQQAKSTALKAIDLNPKDGMGYIALGDIYASSASMCSENDLTKNAVFWLAVDQYNKAKKIDPSIEEIANKKIALYSRYFPSNETIFFYNLEKGKSYTLNCWGESTIVR